MRSLFPFFHCTIQLLETEVLGCLLNFYLCIIGTNISPTRYTLGGLECPPRDGNQGEGVGLEEDTPGVAVEEDWTTEDTLFKFVYIARSM